MRRRAAELVKIEQMVTNSIRRHLRGLTSVICISCNRFLNLRSLGSECPLEGRHFSWQIVRYRQQQAKLTFTDSLSGSKRATSKGSVVKRKLQLTFSGPALEERAGDQNWRSSANFQTVP